MTQKISITLEEHILNFIDSKTNNRSQFINTVLSQLRQQEKLKELEQAYIDQANNSEEIAEIKLWDQTVADGLEKDE